VNPAETALLTFSALILGTERLPCPPHLSLSRIQTACFQKNDRLAESASTSGLPTAPPAVKKLQVSQGKKKRSRASDSRDRQRQLVVSHSVLIGLSQNVVNLADDDAALGTDVTTSSDKYTHGALVRLPVQLLIERYLMLILNALGNVVQGASTTSQHKLRALRVLEVRSFCLAVVFCAFRSDWLYHVPETFGFSKDQVG
jgi:hypothetical protein